MGATAGATLSALIGREPRPLHAQGSRPSATADAVIVLWMAGGMAQTETWDPKRYTPFEPGVRTERVLSTFPEHRYRRRQHQDLAGSRACRPGDGPRRDHQNLPGGRSRIHPALAPPVPLAHRLHSAADGRDAAHRFGDCQNARSEESDRAAVHLHRPEHGNRRRERSAQGLSHRRLPRFGARSVSDYEPARCRRCRSAAGRAWRKTLPEPSTAVREAAGQGAGLSVRGRLPARIAHPIARIRRSPVDLSVSKSLRSVARTAANPTTPTTPADSVRGASWRGVSSKPAPASWR